MWSSTCRPTTGKATRPLGRAFTRTVIYELHVRGFTAHPNSGVGRALAGTYAGLIAKIPYLRSLGITAVELMPVQAFDPQDAPPGLVNYWGYSPVSFFAAHPGYASTADPLGALDEFRTMVKALHRAGIEVILDVVFNHTAEGGADGPTFCWRGLDDDAYYLFDGGLRQVRELLRLRQHHQRQPRHRAADDPGQPAPLGRPHARRRLPLRFGLDPVPRLRRAPDGQPAGDLADRDRPGAGRHQADRRGVGRRRASTRSGRSSGTGGANGTAASATTSAGSPAVTAAPCALLPNRLLASPDLFGGRPAEVDHSINFVTATTGSPSTTWSATTASTTRPTWRTTGTAATGSTPANSGSKGLRRPGDRAPAPAGDQEPARNHAALRRLPHARDGRRSTSYPARQQQRLLPGQPDILVRLVTADRHAELLRFVKGVITVRMGLDLTTFPHGLSLREFVERLQVQFHGVRLHQPDWSETPTPWR